MTTETEIVPTAEAVPALSEREILFATTNDPALASDEFILGPRTFKIMNLGYDDYIVFASYLKPFLDGIGKALITNRGISVPDIEINPSTLNASALFSFCAKDLPEMVRIVCVQTDKTVTAKQIKEWAGQPFILCEIVIRQVARNNMIAHFASFFVQLLPILARMGLTQKKATESQTKETPSS